MEVKKAFSFIEGLSVTFNPWLAIIAGAIVYITKRENRYYSEKRTSIIFIIGAISGILFGLIGFGKEYLQWWNLRGPKDEAEKSD